MSKRERELENARSVLLKRMQESQGHQSLSEIRQELRAIDAEMDHLKKAPTQRLALRITFLAPHLFPSRRLCAK
jgi:hypothetical protein